MEFCTFLFFIHMREKFINCIFVFELKYSFYSIGQRKCSPMYSIHIMRSSHFGWNWNELCMTSYLTTKVQVSPECGPTEYPASKPCYMHMYRGHEWAKRTKFLLTILYLTSKRTKLLWNKRKRDTYKCGKSIIN